jgi:Protein of unknown function (DUF2946)
VFRRVGATLGVLAILFQCLVLAVHQPAQAAPLLPFQDPGAWCGALADTASGTLPDDGIPKSAPHAPLVCPICQTLHVAATGLLPVLVALVLPVRVAEPHEYAAHTSSPDPFGYFAANPRAPPAVL